MPFKERLNQSLSKLITEEDHKYGCLMAVLSKEFASEISEWATKIDPKDISDGNLETEIHITVLYGFNLTTKITDLYDFISRTYPFEIELQQLSLFENDEDVLKVDVISQKLTKLHYDLVKQFNVTETHPGYTPHMTIGYLNSGAGKKYLGDDFCGRKFLINQFTYSSPDSEHTHFYLG